MMTILFALLGRSKHHLVHNLVSDHHQVVAEVEVVAEYIQDYVMVLIPMAESNMDVNACNTKASSL